MRERLRAVCVYCGSSPGDDARFVEAARAFGELLGRHGIRLVYGGGNVGLMGAVADGALAAGGVVVGVIPRALVDRELAHRGVQELVVVGSMHERKATMERLSDAFVALPGGIGTLDELFEIWTWRQLGIHDKPIGVLDVDGYWGPLFDLVERITLRGFLREAHRSVLLSSSDGESLLARLEEQLRLGAAPASPDAPAP